MSLCAKVSHEPLGCDTKRECKRPKRLIVWRESRARFPGAAEEAYGKTIRVLARLTGFAQLPRDTIPTSSLSVVHIPWLRFAHFASANRTEDNQPRLHLSFLD